MLLIFEKFNFSGNNLFIDAKCIQIVSIKGFCYYIEWYRYYFIHVFVFSQKKSLRGCLKSISYHIKKLFSIVIPAEMPESNEISI